MQEFLTLGCLFLPPRLFRPKSCLTGPLYIWNIDMVWLFHWKFHAKLFFSSEGHTWLEVYCERMPISERFQKIEMIEKFQWKNVIICWIYRESYSSWIHGNVQKSGGKNLIGPSRPSAPRRASARRSRFQESFVYIGRIYIPIYFHNIIETRIF